MSNTKNDERIVQSITQLEEEIIENMIDKIENKDQSLFETCNKVMLRGKVFSDFEEFYDILKQEGVVHQFYFPVKMDTTIYQKLPAVMEMYDAYDADHQEVYAFKASGKVSGAFINIYPPGIPLVVPGEIMNDKLIDDVIKAVNSGLEVDGLYFDPDANMWKFVAVL